jgi:chemotaxis protein CheX
MMVSETLLDVYRNDMVQVASDVFQTMVNLAVEPCVAEWQAEPARLTGVVQFAGQWRGAVLIELSPQQAYALTHRLMSIPEPCSITEDVMDVVGELTNMIGGNMKCVMPRGVGLSIPMLVEGSDYSLRLCGEHSTSRVAFTSELGLFWVTLVEIPSDNG